MSLAMYAAPFDNDSSDYKSNDNDNVINKKRQTHNKTQKKYPKENFDQQKVNSVLEQIHNNSEEEDTLANFSPPPKPESAGVNKTNATNNTTKEMMHNMGDNNQNIFRTLGKAPSPNSENSDDLDLNNFNTNYDDNDYAEKYYKKFLTNFFDEMTFPQTVFFSISNF